MRDHSKLKAFHPADTFVLLLYRYTKSFPRDEQFGLTSQIRRAAVSAVSNIVEGCSRSTQSEYVRFLEIAYGSAKEVQYQLSLAHRLGYLPDGQSQELNQAASELAKVLSGLILSLRAT